MKHVPVKVEASPEDHALPKPSTSIYNMFSNGRYDPLESDSSSDDDGVSDVPPEKKLRILAPLPVGFLDPLSPEERVAMQLRCRNNLSSGKSAGVSVPVNEAPPPPPAVKKTVKQFWKAGEYEASRDSSSNVEAHIAGIDHVRVHPKFLHSNATSHKWALGAIAELLDNALDEVRNGATYVNVDILKNKKYPVGMLMVEDNGGGMTPDDIRRCMSLGYSAKSQMTNTIGQYGNGFKTSTMRLGADVIVFSRCRGKNSSCSTQSIGMLSYTFLTQTGKEDIVVPMLDYETRGDAWRMNIRSSLEDWNRNLELIRQWSPYESEEDLLHQFDHLEDQGTRIVIYNLWEDEQGLPELDFQSEEHDIQTRGTIRDEKKIQIAKDYPNLRHYLNYQHSLRHYAGILYLEIPRGFRMTLRGREIEHYDVKKDLIHKIESTYRPQGDIEEAAKFSNLSAQVHVGFIRDADKHLDVQGFNVYHKNRLIKPFWRVWNPAGSDGRGVIGVIEANFIQPAHDKQGFERTILFQRLENRLIDIQKKYWSHNCQKVGYSARVNIRKRQRAVSSRSSDIPKEQVFSNHSIHSSPEFPVSRVENAEDRTKNAECLLNREVKMMAVPSEDSEMMKLKKENDFLKASLDDVLHELKRAKDQNQMLENDLQEERNQRELTEQGLRNKIQEASDVIQKLREKLTLYGKLR